MVAMLSPPGHYFGNRVHALELAGYLLTECAYRPGHRVPKHAHERAYFNLVVTGGYSETYGMRRRECKIGSLVFHPAGEWHAERMSGRGARLFGVVSLAPRAGAPSAYGPCTEDPAAFHGGPVARLAFRLYRELRRPDAYSPLVVEGLMLELAAERGRCQNRPVAGQPPSWLGRAQEALRAQFAAPPSLDELAAEVGVHPVHLARTFRARLGCSVGEYIRNLKIEFACKRLSASDATLVDIALAAGFADQSHFARTFKRFRGLTPAEFRRLHRARRNCLRT